MTSATEAAAVLSTGLAALAAGASWRSVVLSQRVWRASVEPDLHLQVILDVANNRTTIVVYNAGGGIAKGAAFMLVGGASRSSGYLRDGFVRPGDKLLVTSEVPATADDETECVVLYRTADESSWVVTRRGAEKRRLRKGGKGLVATGEEIWATVYPEKPYPPFNSAYTVELVEQGN